MTRDWDTFVNEMLRTSPRIRQAVLDTARHIGSLMVQTVKERISEPYPPAGPPWGYPAMRSGRLRRSIRFRIEKLPGRPQGFQIVLEHNLVIAPYGEDVEQGHMAERRGRRGRQGGMESLTRVAPRPHIRPVVEEFMRDMGAENVAELLAGYVASEQPENWS